MPEVGQGLFLGDTPITSLFGNDFVFVNPFTEPEPTVGPVTDGIVLYLDASNPSSYPGSGTTWFDLSGNGLDGTLNGNVTYSSPSSSFYFPRTNNADGVTITHDAALNIFNGDYTIDIWFRNEALVSSATNDVLGIIYKAVSNVGSNPGWGWRFVNNTSDGNFGKGGMVINGTSNTGLFDYWSSDGAGFQANKWYNFQVTKVAGTGAVNNYEADALQFTGNNTANPNNSSNIILGKYENSSGYGRLKGWIGAVLIYDKVLSDVERTQNYNYFSSIWS